MSARAGLSVRSAIVGFGLLLAAGFAVVASVAATEIAARPILPPDITIAETLQGPVLATVAGMTIYKKLPRIAGWGHAANQVEVVGQCVYQCPSEWPPVTAPVGAKPVGDFTIIEGAGGVRQWAYKGVALQTFIFDRAPGHTLGDDTYAFNGPRVPIGEAAWIESEIPPQQPPEIPEPTTAIPPGVIVQGGLAGSRYYADAEGLTLYTYDIARGAKVCAGACLENWRPLRAGALARSIGDWAAETFEDGTRQWTYKGRPVFTYGKDTKVGEKSGDGVEGKWKALAEYEAPLPAQVAVGVTETGPVYVDKASGKTLYFQGFNHRPYQYLGFNHAPHLFGTVNCYNACAKTYPPLLAPADAEPVGEWWVVTRVDGTKQWAYRGSPVYSYSADIPGRHLASYKGHVWTEAIATYR